MKKIIMYVAMLAGGLMLSGCMTWPSSSTDTGTVNVPVNSVSSGDAKKECLDNGFQWNDQSAKCERPDLKTACLTANNQWDEKQEKCDYSKTNCLTVEGNQRNEITEMCEFTKEKCLGMNAQWDEQKSVCETKPETSEQKLDDCVSDGGQWDHSAETCQKKQ